MDTVNCPVCSLPEAKQQKPVFDLKDVMSFIECPRCGPYSIAYSMMNSSNFENIGPSLSAWIRDFQEKDLERPIINLSNLKKIKDSLPKYTPSQKQLVMMRNIERKTKYPGDQVELKLNHDYPLSWASCPEELDFILGSLSIRNLLKVTKMATSFESHGGKVQVKITPEGWDYIERNSKISVISDQAFAAMRFIKDLDSAYENAIKKAIEDAGYKAYRIDREKHGNRIDMKIMAEIKNSRFLVADVTKQNQGVYFEAGYALGLGIPVIWSCKEEDFENRHFDTKQYQHIQWANEEQLREELFDFICVRIGKNV